MLLFSFSVVSDSFVTPWTIGCQALSMRLLRQKYWSGLLFPSPGIKLASPALAGGFFTTEPPGKLSNIWNKKKWDDSHKERRQLSEFNQG